MTPTQLFLASQRARRAGNRAEAARLRKQYLEAMSKGTYGKFVTDPHHYGPTFEPQHCCHMVVYYDALLEDGSKRTNRELSRLSALQWDYVRGAWGFVEFAK